MLSIILYGRNDDHGYNYHKRLAISLNAIAEILTDPQDEILYTDYNSPDDFPTVVEAIQDTLTERAKECIRIFRVRQEVHRRLGRQSPIPLIEPIARNIALRRSNPLNKWVLSTNSDMLFVPYNEDSSLTDIVAGLSDGFYSLPRFELPGKFWEMHLKRDQPDHNISWLRKECARLHLDTIAIVQAKGFSIYDNPGDFQLFLREDLFKLGGFDEEMVLGWHVDTNLFKRACMVLQQGVGLEKHLMAFHCNHAQKISVLHAQNHLENDWNRFINNPNLQPCITHDQWGLPCKDIEEIRLEGSKTPLSFSALKDALSRNTCPQQTIYSGSNTTPPLTYSSSRILPFLTDHLCHIPKTADIVYFGFNTTLIGLLRSYLKGIGFQGEILCREVPNKELARRASILIFDFGFDEGEVSIPERKQLKQIVKAFFCMLKHKKWMRPDTKWIGINVAQTDFEPLFKRHLTTQTDALITGISYGHLPVKKKGAPLKFRSIKKHLLLTVNYAIVRYCFDYAGPLKKCLRKIYTIRRK